MQQPTAGAQVAVSPPMQHFVMNNGRSQQVGGPLGGQPSSGFAQMGPAKGVPRRGAAGALPAYQAPEPVAVSPFTLEQLQLMRDLVQSFGLAQDGVEGADAIIETAADAMDVIDELLEAMPKPKPSARERLARGAAIEHQAALPATAPRRVPRAAVAPAPTDLDDSAPIDVPTE